MVHHGVADQEDLGDLGLAAGCEARNDLTESGADWRGEVAAFESGMDAAHDVGAEGGLRIKHGFDAEDVTGAKVEKLRGDGGGAEVDGNTEIGL